MTRRKRDSEHLRIQQWPLERVADAVGGRLDGGRDVHPAGVSSDTRTIEEGELFVALRGERFDGHEFVADAVDAGATGAVVRPDYEPPAGVPHSFPLVRVERPREALADLGHALWVEAREEGLHTINVTGSNGKTTTKEMLSAVWSTEGSVFATPGNFNNEIGLPLTLCGLPSRAEHVVLEMGANAPGEIAELIRLAPGEERLITSIGHAHTEGFGSLQGVRRAKSEIFEAGDESALGIVPDSEREHLELGAFPGRIWTFGPGPEADLRLTGYRAVDPEAGRFEVELEVRGERRRLQLGLPGRHNGENLACALSTMVGRGVEPDFDAIQSRLLEIELPGGRWRVSRIGGIEVVDDAYNANPTSVRASFEAFLAADPETFSAEPAVPRIAILGDMRELGDGAERLHREVAAELGAAPELGAFWAIGEYADTMAEAAAGAGPGDELDVCSCDDPREVAERLEERSPAYVWMKGSRANELEQIVEQLRARNRDE